MVRKIVLSVFFTCLGAWSLAGYGQGLSLLQLRNKAVAAYKVCIDKHSLKYCKRALTLYEQADALVPNNPKITSKIRKLRRIIARMRTPWWKRKYRNIFAAVKADDLKACKAFLDHGVSPDIRDPVGRTPMHYAAQKGEVDIAQLLRKYHGRLDLTDNDGKTPIDLATPDVKKAFRATLKIHSVPGAEVIINHKSAGTTDSSGDLSIKLDGGTYDIKVMKQGYTTAGTSVNLQWSGSQLVTIAMARVASASKAANPVASTAVKRTKAVSKHQQHQVVLVGKVKKRSRTWAYVTLFSGLAVVGLGGGMTGLAAHERSLMNSARTSSDLDSERSRIKAYNAVAITAYVVGAGLIGTSIYLWLRPKKRQRHTSILPLVGNKFVGAMVRF